MNRNRNLETKQMFECLVAILYFWYDTFVRLMADGVMMIYKCIMNYKNEQKLIEWQEKENLMRCMMFREQKEEEEKRWNIVDYVCQIN